ncbi:MAG TPA: hypothetical protein PLG14_05635 [Spirochaetales bacterium]|nr:hypothetical protein [Spirochaetales bacterium]
MRMNSAWAPLLACALLLSAAGLAGAEASPGAQGGPLPLLAVPASAAGLAPAASAASAAPASAAAPSLVVPAGLAGALDVPDEAELARRLSPADEIPVLANNQVLAFYGHPFSKKMGILGEYSKEELAKLLRGYAKLYDDANGPGLGVVPAFYLIYGTCWPEGEIGYLRESVVKEYIDYAASQGMLVFVDHQIGKYKVEEAVKRLLPFAKYPNVHLALDPEWRTTAPMKEIGSISAEELNKAQAMIDDYLKQEGIPGRKMLVVHQFKGRMIEGRERVRADFGKVILVHTADGFGAPALKRNSYAFNAKAPNMPIKGFKLFFKSGVPGAGYDDPLLTPPEVLALDPMPMLIMYQ